MMELALELCKDTSAGQVAWQTNDSESKGASDDEPGSPIDLGHRGRSAGVLIATSGRKSVSDVRKMFGGDGT
jgi:hypothetical protein